MMNSFSYRSGLSQGAVVEVDQEVTLTHTNVSLLRDAVIEPINMEQLRAKYKDTVADGRRIAPRFPLQMTVIVYNRMKSFRMQSLNVSLSGVLLSESLPVEFAGDDLEVVFIHEQPGTSKKQYMMFRAQVVDQSRPSPRLRFHSSVNTSSQELEKIIEKSKLKPV